MTDRHTGSTFASLLEEDRILEDVEAVAIKRVIAWQISSEMKKLHITKQNLAKTMHTSRTQIDRLLDPKIGSINLTTLTRAAHAVGMRINVGLERMGHGKSRTTSLM
jgi:antitoxin HicB